MVDLKKRIVIILAGNGKGGYDGDGEDAQMATFGSDPKEYFDSPYSLSLDEDGNIYIGDTYNHVVRMIDRENGVISAIAGNPRVIEGKMNVFILIDYSIIIFMKYNYKYNCMEEVDQQ